MADSVALRPRRSRKTLVRNGSILYARPSISFDEIAAIIGRSTDATRQLASRARRRVRGVDLSNKADLAQQRKTVETILAELRARFRIACGRLTLTSWFTPDLIGLPPGAPSEIRGAMKRLVRRASLRAAPPLRAGLVDGADGVVHCPPRTAQPGAKIQLCGWETLSAGET